MKIELTLERKVFEALEVLAEDKGFDLDTFITEMLEGLLTYRPITINGMSAQTTLEKLHGDKFPIRKGGGLEIKKEDSELITKEIDINSGIMIHYTKNFIKKSELHVGDFFRIIINYSILGEVEPGSNTTELELDSGETVGVLPLIGRYSRCFY